MQKKLIIRDNEAKIKAFIKLELGHFSLILPIIFIFKALVVNLYYIRN